MPDDGRSSAVTVAVTAVPSTALPAIGDLFDMFDLPKK
jgi:hypothetical protein